MMVQTHHVAANTAEAARLALAAGVDYDLSDGSVYRSLADQVKQGLVPESEVDRAVARVLAAKFRLGLFDNPYVDPDYAERVTNSEEHRKLALEAARKADRAAQERQESAAARSVETEDHRGDRTQRRRRPHRRI